MSKLLYSKVFNFLKTKVNSDSTLLLGLSGGPDSLALLYVLLDCQKKLSFSLEIAHVDHKQRETSTSEAIKLEQLACKLNLPFHLKTLSTAPTKNLENVFREKRYAFFTHLLKQKDYQALILGHQREDLEETVLKRFLEGAHLENLFGILKESTFEGYSLWRPFLEVSKSHILAYIQDRKLEPILDETNEDEFYLRARMRKTLLPALERDFGKNIRTNLIRHAQSASSLQDYLQKQIHPKIVVHQNHMGDFIDFSTLETHPFEVQYILKEVLHRKGDSLHQNALQDMVEHIISGNAHKKVQTGAYTLYIDRRKVFILPSELPSLPSEPLNLKEGSSCFGPWAVQVEKTTTLRAPKLGVESFFQNGGRFFIQVPYGKYELLKPELHSILEGAHKDLNAWWTEHKVPRLLAKLIPVIGIEKRIKAEVLTEKTPFVLKGEFLNISLTFKMDL